ncbi:exodeoxyribonuclease VII large subunit [Sporolactobacillus sp. THM19-2]|uniref:exodeoxyribonuclease VII large subunit n=1 Tax=Sporolactobacillus sp. THM19-2 TaxID=2511171 RepID=UPI001020A2AD|nr:exodeoxyribonuclease VII large subunit [Sporolactobacillus sp. THM19-2]RYL87850.1 exodeoxyribonuclease VII large subunit [Sporolactobacillus sp. THM19-2]
MIENDKYISVTRLTRYIRQMLESDRALQEVWLKGEISNFKRHSRGHLYLTLKDKNARIRAVMFASSARHLNFEPKDGMKVLVHGSISLYEPYGEYQIYIRQMEQDGLGRLFLAYEALKRKLQTEGLFEEAHKKVIPPVAYEIGIITSPTGAAVRDLFTTIKRRFPAARITLFPVLVQGADAAPSIASAITRANQMRTLDLLIVGRGGGSIEDLWAFNEEIVARAIFQSRLPVISAVGHETDFTIADFVADKRAPTPTAAGEFAVPDVRELERRIDQLFTRIHRALQNKLIREKERLSRLNKSYAFRYPGQLVLQKAQEHDRLFERMKRAGSRLTSQYGDRLNVLDRLLEKDRPNELIARAHKILSDRTAQLIRSADHYRKTRQSAYEHMVLQLNALSPLKVMARGYSIVYDQDKHLVRSVKDVSPGDPLSVRLRDGNIDCQIWGIEEAEKNE